MNRDSQIRYLLARDLPLDGVGPQLRRSVRRALATSDSAQILAAARAVVGELLRQGVLLRVSVHGDSENPGHLCLKRGTRELVDLSVLGDPPAGFQTARITSLPPDRPGPAPAPLQDMSGVLGAMEQAQDLQISGVQSGETAVILGNILRLLANFTPQFRLFIMLHGSEAIPADQPGIFHPEPRELGSGWLPLREPGHSVWIPGAQELPGHILAGRGEDPDAGFVGADAGRIAAVAVPLWEPSGADKTERSLQEAGLFFLVGSQEWGRDALLKLAGRLASFVTNRWRHQRDVNQRIHKDALTGVCNRAFFDTQFTLELERARRSENPLTLVIADLDHFKAINDRCGHQAGDQVLKMVARRLQEELRRIDHVCRIGGEEFALVLPDTSQAAGQEVMGRLLRASLAEEIRAEGHTTLLKVTFSYGAVTFPDAGTDAFELYRKADAMLYLSKDLGRNQCHFWSSEGQHVQLKAPVA